MTAFIVELYCKATYLVALSRRYHCFAKTWAGVGNDLHRFLVREDEHGAIRYVRLFLESPGLWQQELPEQVAEQRERFLKLCRYVASLEI